MKDKALVKNAADPEQVKEAADKEKFKREHEIDDVRYILASQQGRRFIWKYLDFCGVFRTSFTGNSETFFKEGIRNVGLKILADLNEADPMAYVKILDENKGDLINV